MILNSPFIISARLAPAVKVGDATISLIERTPGREQRIRCHFAIDTPEFEYVDANTQTGNVRTPSIESMFENFLGFLEAAAESGRYHPEAEWSDPDSNASLFPPHVVKWAIDNEYGISELLVILGEATEDLISDD